MDRRDVMTRALGLLATDSLATSTHASEAGSPPAGTAVPPGANAMPTALERSAGITAVHPAFAPGDVRRYGAMGDGAADDAPAWRRALSTGHRVLGGDHGQTYCFDSPVRVTRAALIDLQGAVIRPRGDIHAFVHEPAPATAASMVSAGATQGSRVLTLASSAGFRAGQWLQLALNDFPLHDPATYPPAWTRVVAVRGNTVELETPLQVSYGAGTRAAGREAALLTDYFECRNGSFDGTDCTRDAATGQALRIGGVQRVIIADCAFVNFRRATPMTTPVQVFMALDVLVGGCRFVDNLSHGDVCDLQDVRHAQVRDNLFDGSHFGCDVLRADALLFAENVLRGQRMREGAEGVTPARSMRGLKAYGCASARILGNYAADYESGIKVQGCFRYDVSHNTLFNCGLAPYSGQIALNVGSINRGRNMHSGYLLGNHVECCGGVGIGVTSDAGGVILSGNMVRAAQGMGIYVAVEGATLTANRVEDWGLRDRGDAAIRVAATTSVADNRFAHTSLTALPCIARPAATDPRSLVRDNISETGNPLYG